MKESRSIDALLGASDTDENVPIVAANLSSVGDTLSVLPSLCCDSFITDVAVDETDVISAGIPLAGTAEDAVDVVLVVAVISENHEIILEKVNIQITRTLQVQSKREAMKQTDTSTYKCVRCDGACLIEKIKWSQQNPNSSTPSQVRTRLSIVKQTAPQK